MNKIPHGRLLITALAASLLVACDDSKNTSSADSGGTTPPSAPAIDSRVSGSVIDGYVRSATVCFDSNLNNVCDTGESRTTSSSGGQYQLTTPASPTYLLALGGVNIDTDTANTLQLRAPRLLASSETVRQITPLSTLVVAFTGATGTLTQVQAAEAQIKQAMALPAGFALLATDPIAQAGNVTASPLVRDGALTVFKRNVQVANTVLAAQALSADADALVSDRTLSALRLLVERGAVDLTDATQLQALLQGGGGAVAPAELVTRLQEANRAVATSQSTTGAGQAQRAFVSSLSAMPPEDPTVSNPEQPDDSDPITPTDPTPLPPPAPPADPSQVQPVFDQLCNIPVLGQGLVDIAQNVDPAIQDCRAAGPDVPFSPDALQTSLTNVLASCTDPASAACQEAVAGNLGAITGLCAAIPEGTPQQLVDGCTTLAGALMPGAGSGFDPVTEFQNLFGGFDFPPALPGLMPANN